jgi:hypothetical protein
MKNKYLIPALIGGFILFILIRRRKMSNFKTQLVELANQAWQKWNLPTKVKEGNPKTMQDLKSYYRAVGLNYDGQKAIRTAWSASFNSWLMKQAGAGSKFKYGAAHSIYIQDAKKNREKGIKTFQAFKPSETQIEIGDLVCYPRQDGIKYETPGNYLSHCDIITEIQGTKAVGIGGNVSDSVSKSSYTIDNSGKVTTPKVHVIIKNYL